MLRRTLFGLLPLLALALLGCPGGAGGDNFLLGKWTAPEPCVLPKLEFTPNSTTQTTKQIANFPPETDTKQVVYTPDGADRMLVAAAAGALNSVPYKRIDADHMTNVNIPDCTYTREK